MSWPLNKTSHHSSFTRFTLLNELVRFSGVKAFMGVLVIGGKQMVILFSRVKSRDR